MDTDKTLEVYAEVSKKLKQINADFRKARLFWTNKKDFDIGQKNVDELSKENFVL